MHHSDQKQETNGSTAVLTDANPIPAELRERKQWVVWKWVTRDGKPTKPPIDPKTERPGDATDSSLWLSYAEAVELQPRFDGIGLAVTEADPFCGIDLDKCLDDDGNIAPWAEQIVQRFASYTERTPSGHGLRVWIRGKLPPKGRRKGPVEMYDDGRYFTVTGRRWGDETEIKDRSAELVELHLEIFGAPTEEKPKSPPTQRAPLSLSDEDILKIAYRSKDAAKIRALMAGDVSAYGDDDNRADLALCNFLRYFSIGDRAAVDRIFRSSGLMREKWDSDYYRERTLNLAFENTDVYDPNYGKGAEIDWNDETLEATKKLLAARTATNGTTDNQDDHGRETAPAEAAEGPGEGKHEPGTNGAVAKGKSKPEELPEITDDDVEVVCLADVVEKEIQWLMPGRIPLRKVVFLGGMQKGGKSFFTADLAARISAGAEIPAGNGECFEPGDVVWLCGEDDLDDTVKPRVRRAGADMSRIFAFNGIKHDRSGRTLSFKLEHVRYLEYVISRRKDPRLVIIDPLAHFVGRMKTRQTEEYREIIGPLKELAAASNTTILLIGHLNKGNSTNAIHRFGGDQAPTQIARANWLLMKDPDDPERRLLLDAGTNLCKEPLGLAFRITDDGRVQWEDKPVEMDANEGLAEAAAKGPARRKEAGKRGPDPIKTTRQAEWLFDYLKARGQAAQLVKIFDAAGEAGLVGEKGPNKKWSAVGNLYKAMDLVPNLPPPRGGFMVKERDMKIGGVGRAFKHWQLVKLPPSDESGQPEPGEPEDIVCHDGAGWSTDVPAQTEVAPEGVPF
jgi:putative DNA primase/helicase